MVTRVSDDRTRPQVEAVDSDLTVYFRLCEEGYARSISEAEELDARTVLQALARIKFLDDYERAYWELNK